MAERGAMKWIITLTVITAATLELVDTTIVNVSLPQIMGNLGATLEDIGWLVTSYAVANVIILPMSGWLGMRFGRKRYFLTSIINFHYCIVLLRHRTFAFRTYYLPGYSRSCRRGIALHMSGNSFRDLAARRDRHGNCALRLGSHCRSDARSDDRRLHHRSFFLAVDILCKYSCRNCSGSSRGLICKGV